jgi:hypothetical protein
MAAVAKENGAELRKAVDAYWAAHPEDRTFDGRRKKEAERGFERISKHARNQRMLSEWEMIALMD